MAGILSRINVFSPLMILMSIIGGCCVSVIFGFTIYRQASPNFDKRQVIVSLEAKLNSINRSSTIIPRIDETTLSSYNKKIANARLLTKYNIEEISKINDTELLKLKDSYKQTALRPFAIKEYGIIVVIIVAIFASGITIPAFWLTLCCVLSASTWFRQSTFERLS